jgi:hypothetical protein
MRLGRPAGLTRGRRTHRVATGGEAGQNA